MVLINKRGSYNLNYTESAGCFDIEQINTYSQTSEQNRKINRNTIKNCEGKCINKSSSDLRLNASESKHQQIQKNHCTRQSITENGKHSNLKTPQICSTHNIEECEDGGDIRIWTQVSVFTYILILCVFICLLTK